MSNSAPVAANQPIVFRHALILQMDDAHTVIPDGDLLVTGGKIAAIGPNLPVPDGTHEIDATGGILLPGMVDTHRHMWQTAMRGYGADWTLTQYFVWYYLEHGMKFRPEDIAAGNRLSALEAVDSGVTTSVDWSHGLRTPEHGSAAVEALATSPGRYVFAYGNIAAAPSEWTADPQVRAIVEAARDDPRLFGAQLAFDVPGDDAFPERAAFAVAKDLGVSVTTHAGVWGATGDKGIHQMYEAGVMEPGTVYVHSASLSEDSYQMIAATGGVASLSTESEETCGQGYPPAHALRRHGIQPSLSVDTSVWFAADLFSAMRATVGADRALEHYLAHANGETVTHVKLRAEDVVDWATRGGAKVLGKDDLIGSLEVGKLADVVLIKNDDSPTMTPILNPYGHLVYQAGRGDVHTVLVGGEPVKWAGKLCAGDLAGVRDDVNRTIGFLRAELGDETWRAGMYPDIPETEILTNPYQYRRTTARAV